ncbi:MAG: PspA/IM30 family protein [Gemmataceae bacterium]|nr:PspA/IM30 family protein [Gemmataceae bacterium]
MKRCLHLWFLYFFCIPLCSLCLCGESRAALDPEVKKPYHLQVVLRVAPHRLLTPVFKDQLKRELRDSLQASLGPLGIVEVVDDHPLLKDIDRKGLQAVIDGFDKSKAGGTPIKTHFVLVDYVDNQYDVQAAQHDGLTGLSSPIVRRSRTDDRQLVAKLAALLVDRDLGLVGTVVKKDGQRVDMVLKGGALGTSLERWVKKDDLFAIAKVSRTGNSVSTARVPEAYLQVTEVGKDGTIVCRLFNRYADDDSRLADGKNVLGYRCLKLGTAEGPLRLRLVDAKGLPQDNLQIETGGQGFDKREDFKYQGSTRTEGLLQTEDRFQNIAFVRVLFRKKVIAQVPVVILDDRVTVLKVNIEEQGDTLAQTIASKKRLLERLNETLLVQDDLRKELGALMAKSEREQALFKARNGVKGLEADLAELGAERTNLNAEVVKLPPKSKVTLADCDQRIRELESARDELKKFADDLDEIIVKLKNDSKSQAFKSLVLQARNFVKEGNYTEAIRVYDSALAEMDQPQLRKEVDELKRAWTIKSPEHEKARRFIYEVWPNLDVPQKMKDRLPEAQRALQTCKDAGDMLTPQKLLQGNLTLDARLNKLMRVLKPDREDDRRTIEIIEKVAAGLETMHNDAVEYLGMRKPPAK